MDAPRITVAGITRLLPMLEELEPLRLAFVGAAEPDPGKEWDRSNSFTTIDNRTVPWAEVARLVEEAEAAAHAHVSTIFSRVGPLLAAVRDGREIEAVRQLVQLGEHYESLGLFEQARQCFDAGLTVSLPLADKEAQVLALRRIARVAFAKGDPFEALAYYERSATLAADSRLPAGEVIARTGMGNVLSVQGWLAESERCYRTALARLEESGLPLELERAQLYNNLGFITMQQGKLGEARQWLSEAEERWRDRDSPNDLAICFHNQGRLRELEGQVEEGNRIRERALQVATLPQVLAGISVDLAEACLKTGRESDAERWGREAEQFAIAARSPWLLGRIYQGLGNIARARGSDDGFVFYEKAIEIAKQRSLPFLEADTLVDYAILRSRTGDTEEARAFLEHALTLLDSLGAVHERDRARGVLAALPEAGLTDHRAAE